MKNAFILHINAIKQTFNFLKKGQFIAYFVPGIIVTFIFISLHFVTNTLFENPTEPNNWIELSISKIGNFIHFIFNKLYIFIILTLLSPFNNHLSEKLATKITGQQFKFGFFRLIKDMYRMCGIVITFLIFQITINLIISAIYWIFDWSNSSIYEIIHLLIGSFFIGYTFYDYNLERDGLNVSKRIHFASTNLFLITLTGILFYSLYYFPYIWKVSYIGIAIAPVITTMIATIVYIKIQKTI